MGVTKSSGNLPGQNKLASQSLVNPLGTTYYQIKLNARNKVGLGKERKNRRGAVIEMSNLN